ncbi:MAG: spheroidene monooxygenase [Bacteroidales bacterium]|nr:spheroidene monooxygenase [Bacteroidales bacterium]
MKQMRLSVSPMRKMEGLQFFKPLGTGSGTGYSMWPDFSVYGLLAVWKSHEQANSYLESQLFRNFVNNSVEQYTIFLTPISSHGSWSGFNKWEFADADTTSSLICVLTRASLRKRFLFRFLRLVPRISAELINHQGLIFSKGIGEYPVFEQATFSIWENASCLDAFVGKPNHMEAIRKAREHSGFKEEMFTRLRPYLAIGTWQGKDLLKDYLSDSSNSGHL